MISAQWTPPGGDSRDAFSIREEVFINEQKVSLEDELDGMDPVSWHLVLYEDEKPVATGRMYDEGGGVWHFGRIAVKKELRGHNLGRRLLAAMLPKARELGAKRAELGAQLQARGFYEKLGFTAFGETFMDAGIPHIHMYLTL